MINHKIFNNRKVYFMVAVALCSMLSYAQEEKEAKYLKKRSEIVDSVPFVVVNASKPQWKISKYLTGSHFVYAFENDSLYKDQRIQQWMKSSKTGIIRWPGGTVVQYYHWNNLNGIPFSDDSWNPDYDGKKRSGKNYMDLDEYIAFCRKVNAAPMVGVNLRSGKKFGKVEQSLDEAKKLITYCKRKNYEVKYWYMGNENYKIFSAKEYAQKIDQYAAVLKSVDPNITIIADWKFGPYKKNRFRESIEIAKASKHLDVMEFHEKWGNPWGLKSGHTVKDWHQEYPLYDGKLSTLIQRFQTAMRKANKKVKVGFNEWGLGEINNASPYDYGIVAADFMVDMFKNNVFQACYWNLNMGTKNAKVLKTNSLGTRLEGFNPVAKVFQLFAAALNKQYLYLDCTDKYIYGFGAKNPKTGRIILYLLNKSKHGTPVNFGVFGRAAPKSVVDFEQLSRPGKITQKTFKQIDINEKQINLAPSSLTKITIRGKSE